MKTSIIILRIIHGLFAAYFIGCIIVIYYSVFTGTFSTILAVAICSLVIEGAMVFILNKGDCPLKIIQERIDDPVPFFNLFLPAPMAKKAIPFFSIITFIGLGLLLIKLGLT